MMLLYGLQMIMMSLILIKEGYVYAKHAGTATLTATKDNASVTCVIKVEALHPYLSQESLDVYTSEPATLTVNDFWCTYN